MGNVVSYTHASPLLREKLLSRVVQAHNAKTQRDRQAHFEAAYAYADAIAILNVTCPDTHDGIHLADSYNKTDWGRLRKFLSSERNYRDIMGPEAPKVEPVFD